ncbi:hypothetical protein AAVH_42960, partial [Aphelenchoides avenae]
MGEVIEAGSIEKARSLGMSSRCFFEHTVEDGLLVLTPGKLDDVSNEITDSVAASATTLDSARLAAPIGEEGNSVASGYYFSLSLNVFLLAGLLAALLSNRDLVKRIRTWIDEHRRKREALLGA